MLRAKVGQTYQSAGADDFPVASFGHTGLVKLRYQVLAAQIPFLSWSLAYRFRNGRGRNFHQLMITASANTV